MGKLGRHFGGILLLLGTLYGCTTVYQQIVAASRQPGEHVRTTPDQIWSDFKCGERELPFLRVESLEVVPEMLKPGGRANYRLVYVMCPQKPSEVLKTRVSRKLLFKGEQVAVNVNHSLELKPGRWVVDSFFTLPENSPLGVYALEVTLEPATQPAQKTIRSFVVTNDYNLGG